MMMKDLDTPQLHPQEHSLFGTHISGENKPLVRATLASLQLTYTHFPAISHRQQVLRRSLPVSKIVRQFRKLSP